jgi:hypothetical protein
LAQRLDDGGKRLQRRVENSFFGRLAGFVATAIVTAVLLYIVHSLVRWEVPYVKPSFRQCIPAIDLSLLAGLVGSALRLAYGGRWFRQFTDAFQAVFAINATYVFYRVYPLDLPLASWTDIARVVILLVIALTALALVVNLVLGTLNFVRFVSGEPQR